MIAFYCAQNTISLNRSAADALCHALKEGNILHLDLSLNNISHNGAQMIGQSLEGVCSIKKLNLTDCKLDSFALESMLTRLTHNVTITELKLDKNKFRPTVDHSLKVNSLK